MVRFIGKVVIVALAALFASYILPGVEIAGFLTALLVAVVLGVLNAIVKPVLVIITIPITILTLGVFLLVINTFIVYLAGEMVSGFTVGGFWSALFFSMLTSFFTSILELFTKDTSEEA